MYCTVKNIQDIYPQIDKYNMSEPEFENFISKADNFINAKLGATYVVPFTAVPSTPPLINNISAELALVYVFTRHYTQEKRNTSEWVKDRKKEVMQLLKDIVDEKLTIVTSDGAVVTEDETRMEIVSTTKDFKPVFDMRDEEYWRVDPDEIDFENDEDST